jgi:hypothetical protein
MDPNRTQGLKRMTAPNGGIMSKVYVCASRKSIELGLLRVNLRRLAHVSGRPADPQSADMIVLLVSHASNS